MKKEWNKPTVVDLNAEMTENHFFARGRDAVLEGQVSQALHDLGLGQNASDIIANALTGYKA